MQWTTLKWIKLRVLLISCGFVIFLGLILFRSYQLQITENNRVHNLASSQYKAKLIIQPKRGSIYDRSGEVLAMDVQVSSIAIHPHLVKEHARVVSNLSKLLNVPASTLEAKLKSKRKFAWVKRRVPQEIGDTLEKLDLDGVAVMTEYRRFYPNKELAGQVLGAVGYDAKALGGLELGLDSYLRSYKNKLIAQRDARGRLFTPIEESNLYHDVHLTLDLNIQFIAEKHLWEQAQKYQVSNGFAIVMDPRTGEILAMANYPSFNPNTYWEYSLDKWKNNSIINAYEPGSTFKSVIIAAALSSGRISTKEKFFCENGRYRIGSNVINDHKGYGNLDVGEILKVSSNIGVTKIAQKLGKKPFYQMVKSLGFGEKTGVYMPGENPGFISKYTRWTPIDFSNIAFGQGIAVNGLQMAQAYSSIANGGMRMKPYIVSKISHASGGTVLENNPEIINKPFDKGTATNLAQMLSKVIGPGGTGKLALMGDYEAAGKTGTAQKINHVTKRYDEKNYVSSFIGFAPLNDPRLVTYVVYDSPKPVYAGGLVAAPVFKDITREALAYQGVAPSEKYILARNH